MPRSVALQMDPLDTINIDGDSTFVLGLEAQRRGYTLFHYLPQALSWRDGQVCAQARPLTLRRARERFFELGPPQRLNLETVDVVLMRQDPPFDMAYITATHVLEQIHPRTLVVNDPAGVRNAPEKLLVTCFSDLMPETLITRDAAEIRAFRAEHGGLIVKPLYGNGGAQVFYLRPDDSNLSVLLEMMLGASREPLMIQRYLPEVSRGDKRVILIEGEPAGAINRVPPAGETRSNMHVGGRPEAAVLTSRDRDICARIGPTLRDRGLTFAGIDIIGPYLTEINVTSPTGLQEVNRFDDVCLEAMIWDAIEARLARRR